LPPAEEISRVEGERLILRLADPKNNIKRVCARIPHRSALGWPWHPASIPFWLANGLADALCWLQWNTATGQLRETATRYTPRGSLNG